MAKKTKSNRGSEHRGGVDLAELERLLEFMHRHRLEEFEYERDGVHVMLKKASAAPAGAHRSSPLQEAAGEVASESVGGSIARAESAAKATPVRATAEDLHVIKSPIVGTFYVAASPDAEPFVSVGTQVDLGQVLCIIEAMKLMNEIEADVAGEVTKIFVENEQPVEYGQPLFGIRPSRKK